MMYKLQDGNLITPPAVFNGIVGYSQDEELLWKDGWKPLKITGEGDSIVYVEHAKYIEEKHFNPEIDYRAARAAAYPPLGDVIDALLKAYTGDTSELDAIIAIRAAVKQSIKKPK